jgi:hypothetical protein
MRALVILAALLVGCGGPQTVDEVVQFDSAVVAVTQHDDATEVGVHAEVTLMEAVPVPLTTAVLILDDGTTCLVLTLDTIRYAPPIDSLADERCTRWIAGRPIMSVSQWRPVATDTAEVVGEVAKWIFDAVF